MVTFKNVTSLIGKTRYIVALLYFISRKLEYGKMFIDCMFFLSLHIYSYLLPIFLFCHVFLIVSMNKKGYVCRILTPSHICRYFSQVFFLT